MKNLTYIPFKKNRYFHGKLLTAEDFKQEQQYVDDKRRLINRWVLGAGIVAGLEVIRVDDYSISIEMGLALDYTGREIVVDMPVIRKLSLIDGYEEATAAEGDESLYLCMEYAQTPVEPVHNITNRSVHTTEEETFNKYREDYRLYVTDAEPTRPDEENGETDRLRSIYDRAERIHEETYERGITLARIELVKAGDFYMIERVVPLPRGQFVCSLPLAAGMIRSLQKEVTELSGRLAQRTETELSRPGGEPPQAGENLDWQFQQGSVKIPIPAGSRSGHLFFSEEIAHRLGLGDVELMVHVVQGNYSYSGAGDIFEEAEKAVEAAARVSRNRGTFTIGIRLLDTVEEATETTVGWTAIRKRSRNEIRADEARIYISPGLVNLKTRETIKLEAVCVNMEAAQLVWSVESPEGGTVGEDGSYHAPNRPGIYEVSCRKRGAETVRASVYIVVRE